MNRLTSSARLMIVSDLDQTMVDHDDPENLSMLRFNALWEAKYRHDSLLVFSTGRSPTSYKQLRKRKPMLTPDITIMSIGTEITYGNEMVPDEDWFDFLNHKWDKKIVTEETSKFPELTLQSETKQRPHKASFKVKKEKAQEVMKNLYQVFVKRGLDVKIIYSSGMDLDVLPQGAGKGQALAYLHKKLKAEDVHGVIVNNAQEELLEWYSENAKNNPKIIHADETCAAGIIQAIGHFKLGPNTSPRDLPLPDLLKKDDFDPAFEVVKFYLFLERWRLAEVENREQYLGYLKGVCSSCGVYLNPYGVEQSLDDVIKKIEDSCGDKKGKQYRIWVDQVFSSQIDLNTWVVKLKKWEQTGEEQKCCFTTAILSSKNVKVSQGLSWVHVHQTWVDGSMSDGKNWFKGKDMTCLKAYKFMEVEKHIKLHDNQNSSSQATQVVWVVLQKRLLIVDLVQISR
ncbi:hypothetical protein LXL04_012940 [Taraxacum kok-saghyz]